jgi:hypothetical protein
MAANLSNNIKMLQAQAQDPHHSQVHVAILE